MSYASEWLYMLVGKMVGIFGLAIKPTCLALPWPLWPWILVGASDILDHAFLVGHGGSDYNQVLSFCP